MTKIELKGDLSISNAEEILKLFKSACQKKSDITIDVSLLEDVDTSIIQLLYSLFRSVNKDRPITITGPVSQTVKRRLYICGLLPSPDSEDSSAEATLKEILEAAR